MKRDFKEALMHRRSIYALSNELQDFDNIVTDIIKTALDHTPSPYNAQSVRMVLLLGEHHRKFWDIVKETLSKMVNPEQFLKTSGKIEKSFASGYGTILFFDDQDVIDNLKTKFPSYSDNFDKWQEQAAGMSQLVVWTMLEDAGAGASLQHYNPLIDEQVKAQWNIPQQWRLMAQMPFGKSLEEPGEKKIIPAESKMKILF